MLGSSEVKLFSQDQDFFFLKFIYLKILDYKPTNKSFKPTKSVHLNKYK